MGRLRAALMGRLRAGSMGRLKAALKAALMGRLTAEPWAQMLETESYRLLMSMCPGR